MCVRVKNEKNHETNELFTLNTGFTVFYPEIRLQFSDETHFIDFD